MFLKNLWSNIGIKKKLFIISTSIVLATSIIIYGVLFIFFPKIYLNNRVSDLKIATNKLVSELNNNGDVNYDKEIASYAYQNSAFVILTDIYGNVLYSPGKINKNLLIGENRVKIFNNFNDKRDEEYRFSKEIYIKSINKAAFLNVSMPVRINNDVSRVMMLLFPIILLITVGIGMLSAFAYSRVISNPILKINSIAKDIANLDFKKRIEIKGKDELADLSNSINLISENLEETICKLEGANRKLVKDIEKEKELDKRRKDFIRAISHELKTPITVISGQIEGMIYKIGPYKDRDKYLKEAKESVDELNGLVYEIINLARFEENVSLSKKDINLNELVKDVLDGYSYFIEEKNLKVTFDGKELLKRKMDSNIMKKILSNIIGNSIKYSKSLINIKIYDKGIIVENDVEKEFEEGETEKIFNAFYRVDKSRSKEVKGTGLGLYIVKSLMEMHGDLSYKVIQKDGFFKFEINL